MKNKIHAPLGAAMFVVTQQQLNWQLAIKDDTIGPTTGTTVNQVYDHNNGLTTLYLDLYHTCENWSTTTF